MADINPVTAASPQQPIQATTAQAQTATQGAIQTLTAQAPPAVGSVVSGFVVNRDASGNAVIRTSNGDVSFATGLFLKIGSEVALRVGGNAAGAVQATLVSVDGEAPQLPQAAAAADQPDVILGGHLTDTAAQTAAPTAAQAVDEPPPTPNVTVSATVLAPPAEQAQALPAGSQVTLRVTGLIPAAAPEENTGASDAQPASTTAPATNPAQYAAYARAAGAPPPVIATPAPPIVAVVDEAQPSNNTQPTVPTAQAQPTASTPGASVNPAATPAGAIVQTVIAAQTPAATVAQATASGEEPTEATPLAATPAADLPRASAAPATTPAITSDVTADALPQPGQTFTATVLSTPPSGEAIAQSPLGLLQLQAGLTLPAGTDLTLQIAAIALPEQLAATSSTTAPAQPAPVTELARQWTSLQQLFSLLADRDAQTGESFANTSMPWLFTNDDAASAAAQPGQSVSSGLLLFMQALQGGNFTSWLGADNKEWLEDQGHDALVKKAEGEFTSLSRASAESPSHSWQSLFFPVAVNGEVQQARLFVKRDRKKNDDDQEKQEDDTRFVLEVGLSHLGELQMDGFVRKLPAAGTRFDLIIRSQGALSEQAQNDILQIYTAAGEMTGFTGSIAFQANKAFPVMPMDEIPHPSSGVTA